MIKVRTQADYVGRAGYLGGCRRKRGSLWVDSVDTLGIVRKCSLLRPNFHSVSAGTNSMNINTESQ
jgi:hypothetical protein